MLEPASRQRAETIGRIRTACAAVVGRVQCALLGAMSISMKWQGGGPIGAISRRHGPNMVEPVYPPSTPGGELTQFRLCVRAGAVPTSPANGHAMKVMRYLASLDIVVTCNGISWLELMLDFMCVHGCVRFSDCRLSVPTVLQEVRAFTALVRTHYSHLLHPELHCAIKPARPGVRLKGLGIITPLACASFVPVLGPSRWQDIMAHILKLRGHTIAHGGSPGIPDLLPLARLTVKVGCPWSVSVPAPAPAAPAAPAAPVGCEWWGRCHGCGARNLFPAKPIKDGPTWPRVRCGACKRQLRVGLFTCESCNAALTDCICHLRLRRIGDFCRRAG